MAAHIRRISSGSMARPLKSIFPAMPHMSGGLPSDDGDGLGLRPLDVDEALPLEPATHGTVTLRVVVMRHEHVVRVHDGPFPDLFRRELVGNVPAVVVHVGDWDEL